MHPHDGAGQLLDPSRVGRSSPSNPLTSVLFNRGLSSQFVNRLQFWSLTCGEGKIPGREEGVLARGFMGWSRTHHNRTSVSILPPRVTSPPFNLPVRLAAVSGHCPHSARRNTIHDKHIEADAIRVIWEGRCRGKKVHELRDPKRRGERRSYGNLYSPEKKNKIDNSPEVRREGPSRRMRNC